MNTCLAAFCGERTTVPPQGAPEMPLLTHEGIGLMAGPRADPLDDRYESYTLWVSRRSVGETLPSDTGLAPRNKSLAHCNKSWTTGKATNE